MRLSPEQVRTPEQLRQHFDVERELATRLRSASKQDRAQLYGAVYNELFRRVPFHPQLKRVSDENLNTRIVNDKLALLSKFLNPSVVFLELGSGDCCLSFEVAKRVRQVYALDVSDEITGKAGLAPNFKLVISDGTSVPVPEGSVTVAYSYQLMEHVHPDDAMEQLTNIYRALAPGGIYICITPNRLTGPHDISYYFSNVACGFHLKEYTHRDLVRVFKSVGFSKIWVYAGMRGHFIALTAGIATALECLYGIFPLILRRRLGSVPGLWHFLHGAVIAEKPL